MKKIPDPFPPSQRPRRRYLNPQMPAAAGGVLSGRRVGDTVVIHPTPMPTVDMSIDDVFQRRGDGKVVVTGKVRTGKIRAGDRLVVRTPSTTLPVIVEELVGFSPIPEFLPGDNAVVALGGVTVAEIVVGSRLSQDG